MFKSRVLVPYRVAPQKQSSSRQIPTAKRETLELVRAYYGIEDAKGPPEVHGNDMYHRRGRRRLNSAEHFAEGIRLNGIATVAGRVTKVQSANAYAAERAA